MKRNPKHLGSMLIDVRPQTGKCSENCRECFYNLAYYEDINRPRLPDPEEFDPDLFVFRVNAGHDSNLQREEVLEKTKPYKHKFFNTVYPFLWFGDPVVLTVNPREHDEQTWVTPRVLDGSLRDLMFVRYRITHGNCAACVSHYATYWMPHGVPMMMTFMRDMTHKDIPRMEPNENLESPAELFERRKHILTLVWEYKQSVKESMLRDARLIAGNVHMCGTPISNLCKDCQLCYAFYWIALSRMKGT